MSLCRKVSLVAPPVAGGRRPILVCNRRHRRAIPHEAKGLGKTDMLMAQQLRQLLPPRLVFFD